MKVFGLAVTFVAVLLSIGVEFCSADSQPCELRDSAYGNVCVCNTTYCDYLIPVDPVDDDTAVITSSTKNGLRFATTEGKFSKGHVTIEDLEDQGGDLPTVLLNDIDNSLYEYQPMAQLLPKRSVDVKVDRSKKFQKIVGFGGAFTGAVSYLLEQFPQSVQDAVYLSFYSTQGLAYNLMRMSIGGCDFDLEPWAYNEEPVNDTHLTNFTQLSEYDQSKIAQLNRLKQVTGVETIKIIAAAWSPPRWMKTNNKWTGFSRLRQEYYQTWADYHIKFVQLMAEQGFPVWAISTGNEPLNGVFWKYFVRFMSLGWTPSQQGIWVADYLGPTLRKSAFKDVKIFANDDQRYTFPVWFRVMNMTRSESMNYIDGMAVHWYWDDFVDPMLVDITHNLYPDKIILSTESCAGDKPMTEHGPTLGSWSRGEKYFRSVLQDLQHSYHGYIDWNLILNEQGGPNYVNNFVDAPVVVNVTNGEEFYKQPIYYALGHFSKFIPEGSTRIQADQSNINIGTAAFERPDGKITALLFNSARAPVDVTLADSVRGNIVVSIPPQSWHTIVYN